MTEQTALGKRLDDLAARPDAITAFKAARSGFLAGRRLEMKELADELGVNRATLFRWVGGRDELLAEVIWSVAEPTLRRAVAANTDRGARRIAGVLGDFAQAVNTSDAFRQFLRREPERALRLLTTQAGSMQRRFVAFIADLITAEIAAGTLDPPLPVPEGALLLARITETFIYADVISGEEPDAAKVVQASLVLLGERPER
ncbi:QsdR family transcriptional regulator [Nocardia neocaledoniensis]|uniref:QsdR family transcriptional regulator n=1 Tax=Nocardia neocaledoniensis TaxID=236511 RepID=UPI0024543502|nr:QsdR family transcriptional regulator [Nocardia neocaledoniensis]